MDSVFPDSFQRLRQGVFHDMERQKRKAENLRMLNEQIELTKELEAEREKMLLGGTSKRS